MNYNKFRLFSFTTTLMLGVLLIQNVNAEESTRTRIQKHREWLQKRRAEKLSAGYVESSDPYQKIKYFKKLIKFRNQNDRSVNEISFIPRLIDEKDVSDRSNGQVMSNNDVKMTTVIVEGGNKFAYDTINNNEDMDFAGNNASNSGVLEANNKTNITKTSNEVVEQSTPDSTSTNVVKTNNKQQANEFDTSNNTTTGNQMEVSSKEHIGKSTVDVDMKGNTQSNRKTFVTSINSRNNGEISAIANNNSSEKSSNDFEIQRFISEHIKYKSNNITIKKSWGKWSSWSSCSRSCGDGVMSQSRECMEKINEELSHKSHFFGFFFLTFRLFSACVNQKCPHPDGDFRAQQCSEFDNQSFRGQTYKWEPYIKDDAECELNCRPVNQKYFARLREYAIDGTNCSKVHNPPKSNVAYERSVCVEGKCKLKRFERLLSDVRV
ncbi:CLUMA_CG007515, isoform A [Clunio marinus]|uniref:CLUMA_CG007515, isoform A n=1 Tax=Clunio marinus TaxID=568069 RepID=A0A1J1I133_9DIPT|nr:CLUMA_CG007515, isoform A [Clunio marinus]